MHDIHAGNDNLKCPITCDVMRDPVLAAGKQYQYTVKYICEYIYSVSILHAMLA